MFTPSKLTVRSLIKTREMEEIYERLHVEGTYDKVFYDSSISNKSDYLYSMRELKPYLAEYDKELAVMFWLNPCTPPAPVAHFAIFQGKAMKYVIPIGHWCLCWLLGKYPTITGVTPLNNPQAIKYIQKIGMTPIGIIPKAVDDRKTRTPVDALISYITH